MHVFDVLEQLRNRVERRLAFLHTTAHHPPTLEICALVEFDECLMNMTRRIVGQMMCQIVEFFKLVVAVIPMAFVNFEQIVAASGTDRRS